MEKMIGEGEKEKETNMIYGARKVNESKNVIYGACILGALCIGGIKAARAGAVMFTVMIVHKNHKLIMQSNYIAFTKLSGPWYNRQWRVIVAPKPESAASNQCD